MTEGFAAVFDPATLLVLRIDHELSFEDTRRARVGVAGDRLRIAPREEDA
jgi:hypothetical protein